MKKWVGLCFVLAVAGVVMLPMQSVFSSAVGKTQMKADVSSNSKISNEKQDDAGRIRDYDSICECCNGRDEWFCFFYGIVVAIAAPLLMSTIIGIPAAIELLDNYQQVCGDVTLLPTVDW